MDIVAFFSDADLPTKTKEVMLMRYRDNLVYREECKNKANMSERSFYRNLNRGIDYLRSNWQVDSNDTGLE